MGYISPLSSSRRISACSSWYTLGLPDVFGQRRRVRGGRHLIRVVGVDARLDALFLGEPVQLVGIQAVDLAAVLPPVPVEPLGELIGELTWLVYVLVRHRASSGPATILANRASL